MEIQRAKFLLLATALAAPACVTTVTDENAGKSDASTGGTSTGGKSGGTGGKSGSGGSATGGTSATGGKSASGGVSNAGGSSGADGSAGAADGSKGGSGGSSGGGAGGRTADGAVVPDGSRPDGATCDDNTITGGFGNCDLLGADACGIAAFRTKQCNDSKTNMKPFIAQQAIACMVAKASTCTDGTDTYLCKDQALKIACPDPTADDECAHINTLCGIGDGGVDQCRQYLSGMTQAGRDSMVSCMELSCSPGLYSCVEGL
jgi:hypothetical protein